MTAYMGYPFTGGLSSAASGAEELVHGKALRCGFPVAPL